MLPPMRGVIDRRILVNYRVDPAIVDDILPEPFHPQTVKGHAVGGICLIRLRDLRPKGIPPQLGVGSENAAHRIAVEWTEGNEQRTGVYVPRRDTNSRVITLLGGRLFPGVHHHASFEVHEYDDRYEVSMTSDDDETHVSVTGKRAESLPTGSIFDSVSEASRFFEQGSLGHSPNERKEEYEAIELRTFEWEVTPLAVEDVESSYFEQFSDDSVTFDHALLMEGIEHEWHEGESVCSAPVSD